MRRADRQSRFKNTESILDLLTELNNEGMTIIVVTHDENVARRGSRRVTMKDGELCRQPDRPARSPGRSGPEASRHRHAGPVARTASSEARVSRSGIRARDLLAEAMAGMLSRPTRMSLTVLGIVIGMSALVATIGLTRTAGNRIISQFDQLAATELFITARPES